MRLWRRTLPSGKVRREQRPPDVNREEAWLSRDHEMSEEGQLHWPGSSDMGPAPLTRFP